MTQQDITPLVQETTFTPTLTALLVEGDGVLLVQQVTPQTSINTLITSEQWAAIAQQKLVMKRNTLDMMRAVKASRNDN